MVTMIMMFITFFLGFALALDFDRGGSDKTDSVNFAELEEIIDRMGETKRKLQIVDRLLLDLLVADSECGQVVDLTWDDLTKQDNTYRFAVTGDSKEFINAVKSEQEKLRTSLLNDIDEINRLRSYKNGYKNN